MFGAFGGSSLQSKPLSSFAKPGESFKSEKPAKPFGAPDSDAEDSGGEEGGDDGQSDDGDEGDAKDDSDKEEAKASEEKKKKLQRSMPECPFLKCRSQLTSTVALDDGESGEVTILAVRAKLYALEKDHGWRERGSGMLKINVPESCVQFDGVAAMPGSFDASGLDDDEADEEAGQAPRAKVVRLIMRQDSTHRMLLNTVILPAINFQEKTSLKSSGILFTAFEGDGKPVSVQAKVCSPSLRIDTRRVLT